MPDLKLSVLITTWNLRSYVARALDSVLAQRHAYPFEIVIADDGSTDGTVALLLAFKDEHPDLVKLVLHPSHVGLSTNYRSALEACSGQYVAMLDGDDYWTDPEKLKTQIEFLDAHPDYVLSCHRYRKYFAAAARFGDELYPELPADCPGGVVLDPERFFSHWATQTLTVVFRNGVVDLEELESYPSFKDTHLFFCLLQRGKGYLHGFDGGVYYICSDQGHWNAQDRLQRWRSDLTATEEMLRRYSHVRCLSRARSEFRYGVWVEEYARLKAEHPWRLWQRLQLKWNMRRFNPYRAETRAKPGAGPT